MKIPTPLSVFLIMLSTGAAWGKPPMGLQVKPNCQTVRATSSPWSIAFCPLPETRAHYPTEIRFSRENRIVFKYLLLSDPTFGSPEATVLAATERIVVLEIGGDESDQLLAFDLKTKRLVFNSGHVIGMNHCKLNAVDEHTFCALSVTCSIGASDNSSDNYEASIREFLCPTASKE